MDSPLPRETPIARSLAIQGRIIGALLMREVITRFGRHNVGVLWLVLEPMLFTLGVSALWVFSGMRSVSALPIVAFAITGYSSALLWRNTVSRCNGAVQQNANLLYHRNVRLFDVFVARILLEAAGVSASFIVLTLFFVGIEVIAAPADLLTVVAGWVLLAWFGAALAIFSGAVCVYSEVVERLWHTLTYLLFPLSGALFMVDWLPREAQRFVLWIPMVNGTELLREGFFGHLVRTHYDIGYLVSVNLGLTLAGLLLLRGAARRVGST